MDYLNFYQLNTKAFTNICSPEFYYESYDHIEGLNRLIYLVDEGNMGFGMLTGEIGCGKTMTRHVLKERLAPKNTQVLDLDNCSLEFPYLLFELILQLSEGDIDPNLSPKEPYYLLKAFEYYVQQRNANLNRSTVIILDEAQELTPQTLTELKSLTNLNSDAHSYLTIILFGQPELRDLVSSLPTIDQRVSLRFHLNALSEIDVKGYIERRLRVCGHPTGELFDELAIKGITRITHGIPREVNRACQLSLQFAAAQKLPKVSIDIIKAVHHDLQRQKGQS